MTRLRKTALVLAGYAIAPAAAFLLVGIAALLEPAAGQGGMQAFGDLLLFLGLTGLFALIPTALALWFLRPVTWFWTLLTIACALLAATGPAAALLFPRLHEPALPQFLALVRLLGAPLLALAFLAVALIAPARRPRRVLLAATALEAAVSAYAFVSLLIVGRWLL